MTDSEMAQGGALTTEQIATAGRADSTERAGQGQYQPGDRPGTNDRADGQAHAQLLEGDELQNMRAQWKDIQAEFVDEPRKAVQDADALVAELMQRLAQMFAAERDQLESRWAGGDEVSTEDLRDGLRRYRSFFERLLAA
jgi:transposase